VDLSRALQVESSVLSVCALEPIVQFGVHLCHIRRGDLKHGVVNVRVALAHSTNACLRGQTRVTSFDRASYAFSG
jgi:hypothetical protein